MVALRGGLGTGSLSRPVIAASAVPPWRCGSRATTIARMSDTLIATAGPVSAAVPAGSGALRGIGSMATRAALAALAAAFARAGGVPLRLEAAGGVAVEQRVAAGETFDLVVLAADAIDRLLQAGHLRPGSRVDLMVSRVVAAVAAGGPRPDIAGEAALRDAVLAAPAIGYSTGPSGRALLALFDRWGITGRIADRLVQATPGRPVAQLLADGTVTLGFQQRSEMEGTPGVVVLGPLPGAADIRSMFAAAVGRRCGNPEAASAFLRFVRSPAGAAVLCQHWMEPAP